MPTNCGAIAPAFIGRNYMKGQPNKDNTIAFCHNIIHNGAWIYLTTGLATMASGQIRIMSMLTRFDQGGN